MGKQIKHTSEKNPLAEKVRTGLPVMGKNRNSRHSKHAQCNLKFLGCFLFFCF